MVVYRLPAGQSLLQPPSRCPHCHHRLGPSENVPILGWLWLRGRCRHCQAAIALRYPLVEAATALFFLLCFFSFQFSWQTIAAWIFTSWLLALALIDLDTLTLPNVLTQSGLLGGLICQTWLHWLADPSWTGLIQGWMGSVEGAVLGIWLLESLGIVMSGLLGRSALGGGDGKLAAMIGAWLGWQNLLLSLFLAAATGTTIVAISQGTGRLGRGQVFPFGPFLAIGAFISALWGQSLWSAYLKWLL